jgi:polar amino acid transport system substrate-binding protein
MFWHRILVFYLFSSFAISAQQSSQQLPVAPAKTLHISAGEWPPYLSAELPEQGIAARLIKDIFADAGYQVKFHFLPWPRAYRETQLGRYDATAIWMLAPERQQYFWYSNAVLEEQFVFFHLEKTAFHFQSLEDLAGLELGGGLGYSYGTAFDAALQSGKLKISRVGDTTQNFRRLLKGRIVAFPEEIQVGYHKLRRELPQYQQHITHAPLPLLKNQSFVLFPKTNKNSIELQNEFNNGLAKYKKSGRYTGYFALKSAKTN